MKKFAVLLSIFFFSAAAFAQPTQAEIDKMMKEAKAEIEKLKKDPKNKELMKDINSDSIIKNGKSKSPVTKKKASDTTAFALDTSNIKYLRSLPNRTFTKAELVSYVHNLNLILTELLRKSFGTNITNLPDKIVKKTGTGIAFWINGNQDESALAILKGAELNPDNATLLNNAGGILTGCGLGINAIPVLQYVLEKQPGNNMILNNLGQAYLEMGDDKKAEQYFLQCVKSYSYYPDANLALAYIYNRRGNKSSALKHVENSLRGAWSDGAYHLLHKLKPDAKLMDYIRHRYKQPEVFNFNKYPLLPQCRNANNTPLLKPQYAAYKAMLAEVKKKYDALEKQESAIAEKTVVEKAMNANKTHESPYRPFGLFANVVVADLWTTEYSDRFLKLSDYKKNYTAQKEKLIADCLAEQQAITAKHKEKKEALVEADGEGNDGKELDQLIAAICEEKEAVRNGYLNLIADLNEAYQQKALHLYKDYFNDMAFWYYVGSIDDHQYKAQFYGLVSQFLLVLTDINTAYFYTPCRVYETKADKVKETEVEEPDCYIPGKFELPLGIIKLELSCDSYKLEAGEGIVGKMEYSRGSGDFTMALGVGASVPRVFYETPGLEVGLVGDAKSQLYITFDKQGTPTDLGILWESELKLEANMSEAKYSLGIEEGLTAGFGSGVQMKDGGQLKAFIDKTYAVQPDDKQINKNIPLYKK
jgi:hypothetical protein